MIQMVERAIVQDATDATAVENAIEGSTYVIHTASPVAVADPLDEE